MSRLVFLVLMSWLLLVQLPPFVTGTETNATCDAARLDEFVTQEKRLMSCLMSSYDPTVRPARTPSDVIEVSFSNLLIDIGDLDEKTGVLTTDNWMRQVWVDVQLIWNSAEYGNITEMRIPVDRIWTPDIVLFNNAAESFGYVMSKLAVVNNNGTVTWMPHARLRSRCFMDLSLFPYDTQKCTQAFGSWTYDKTLVNLNLVKKTYSSDKFLYQGGEWQVIDYQSDMFEYSDNIKDYKAAIYTLSLKRVTVFYRYILVYPTVIFAILTLFICWIPHESNQRLMLASGILISIIMLMILLEGYLPADIGKLPLIASYLAYNLTFLVFAIVVSLVTSNFYFRDSRKGPVPNWLRLVFLGVVSRLVCVKPTSYTPISYTPAFEDNETQRELTDASEMSRGYGAAGAESSGGSGGTTPTTRGPTMAIEKTMEEIRRYLRVLAVRSDQSGQGEPHRALVMTEWRQLAMVVDRVVFYLFLFLSIIITMAMYARY